MVAWAMEPWRSCFHSRQSKEMDSVNWATSAAGPLAKTPLRDTGDDFVLTTGFVTQTRGLRKESFSRKPPHAG
jgi:hypothetical protein